MPMALTARDCYIIRVIKAFNARDVVPTQKQLLAVITRKYPTVTQPSLCYRLGILRHAKLLDGAVYAYRKEDVRKRCIAMLSPEEAEAQRKKLRQKYARRKARANETVMAQKD